MCLCLPGPRDKDIYANAVWALGPGQAFADELRLRMETHNARWASHSPLPTETRWARGARSALSRHSLQAFCRKESSSPTRQIKALQDKWQQQCPPARLKIRHSGQQDFCTCVRVCACVRVCVCVCDVLRRKDLLFPDFSNKGSAAWLWGLHETKLRQSWDTMADHPGVLACTDCN